jgi:hypothetical protein
MTKKNVNVISAGGGPYEGLILSDGLGRKLKTIYILNFGVICKLPLASFGTREYPYDA